MSRNAKTLTAILAVTVLLFVYVAPQWVNRILPDSKQLPEKKFVLGLDLLGGAHLLYQADFSTVGDIDRLEAMQGIRDVVERRVNFFGVAEPVVQISGEDRLIVEVAGITDVNQAIKLIGETPFLEFKETSAELDIDGLPPVDEENPFGDWKSTGLSGKHVRRAQLIFDPQTGQAQVALELNEEGTELFAEITQRNLGLPVAIFLDGEPISIPTVQSEITDGHAVISGNFTPTEARQLTTRLNSGALPVPIRLIGQQSIGASLGQASLSDSLRAGIWGLLLVAVFMVAFYRLPGAVSVAALLVYIVMVLAVYKVFPVTLTLAGIAGFILSLGMAVDANVLIFARMREEIDAGRNLHSAVQEGFRRAWLSIRDSHVTTLLSALVLYAFTTSIVKGFALTLGIGAILSLFTATVVTRTFLNLFTGPWGQKHLRLFK